MRHLKIPLILFALAGLIALAGCGGDDDSTSSSSAEVTTTATDTTATDTTATDTTATDTTATSTDAEGSQYAQDLTQILTEFGTSFQTLGSALQQGSGQAELASGLDELEAQIQTTIDDLNALQPPPEAQAGQDQMVAAFEAFSSKLTAVSDAVDSGDEEASKQAAQDLQEAAATFQSDFTAGVQAITDAGVSVGPAGG